MPKKLLPAFILFLLLLLLMPVEGRAAETVASGTLENIAWTLDSTGCLTISGRGEMPHCRMETDVPWLAHSDRITSAVIGDGITTVGIFAFYKCLYLESVTIPDGVAQINSHAFEWCRSLKEVILPDTVRAIGLSAFYNCDGLEKLDLGSGVELIANDAFNMCRSLTEVTFPASLTELHNYSFASCDTLTTVTFLGDAPKFSGSPFSGTGIFPGTAVTAYYPSDNATWTANAMTGLGGDIHWKPIGGAESEHSWDTGMVTLSPTCTADGIMTYTCIHDPSHTKTEPIPATGHTPVTDEAEAPTCTADGLTAGSHCTGCGTVFTVQEVVPALGHRFVDDVCENCGAALSGTCGNKVNWSVDMERGILRLTGTGATGDYYRVEPGYILLPNGDKHYTDTLDTVIHEVPWKDLLHAIDYCIVGDGITHIGKGILRDTGLTIFTGDLPEVDPDGNSVSGVCPAENPTWDTLDPDDLHDAFGDMCILPMNGQCGENVFWNMDYMAGTLTFSGTGDMEPCTDWFYIDPNTFRSDDFVERIVVDEGITSVASNLTRTGYGNSYINLKEIQLPGTLRRIGKYAFYNVYSAQTALTLNRGLEVIEEGAFQGFPLTELVLPDSLTSIGAWAFHGVDITSLEIPHSVTEIGQGAFSNCVSLTAVTIHSDILDAAAESFARCHSLKTVTVLSKKLTFDYDPFETPPDSFMGAYLPGTKPELTIRCLRESAIEQFARENGYLVEYLEEVADGTSLLRVAGGNRFETANLVADQMKENLGIEKFDAVVVASGTEFADALAGSYLAAVKNAPILLSYTTDKINDGVKDYIKANLNPGGIVYILGGTNAVPENFKDGLEEEFTVKRLAGGNRFETNLLVLEEAGVDDKPILVCTGLEFADSLSASATKLPILLVYGNKLLDDQVAFLKANQGRDLYIIGGEGAVSAKLESALTAYGNIERVAGNNRFETSTLIAEKFFSAPESAVLAYAWGFPDGLCGGPLATTMNAPLILTMEKYEAKAADYIQTNAISNAVILGGEALIPESSVAVIFPSKNDLHENELPIG